MGKNNTECNKQTGHDAVLESLLEDPTLSAGEIAKKLKSYRQGVWRRKKKLEDDGVIWGYTAVVDQNKLGHIMYLILMKTKPMSRGLADLLIERINKEVACRLNVRLADFWYVNGEFDWVMRFSASNHSTARRYYDTLRVIFEEYLLEKPVIVDVNFCLVAEGKNNPEIEKLYDFAAK
jgi:DNA-binding Lrp family transcriptional regulator